jgi:hypothetical protein
MYLPPAYSLGLCSFSVCPCSHCVFSLYPIRSIYICLVQSTFTLFYTVYLSPKQSWERCTFLLHTHLVSGLSLSVGVVIVYSHCIPYEVYTYVLYKVRLHSSTLYIYRRSRVRNDVPSSCILTWSLFFLCLSV